jgi:hypothetical protein
LLDLRHRVPRMPPDSGAADLRLSQHETECQIRAGCCLPVTGPPVAIKYTRSDGESINGTVRPALQAV